MNSGDRSVARHRDRPGRQVREHTGSYYAATVNETTNYAPLEGSQTADVCIVGAGFTGISTALCLAERGYSVRVVEAHRVGWGASGRNGGQLIGGISGEERIAKQLGREVATLLRKLRWEGHEIIRERVATYGIDCDLKSGYLDVAIRQRHFDAFEREYDRLRDEGFPHELRMLSREETRAVIGTDAYVGALLNMGNGHLHPLNLCIGEARAAASRGAVIHERSPVTEIRRGARPTVVTAAGSVTADTVVIAGNAYHTLERDLRDLMFPVRSFIIATEPLSPATVAEINPRDLAVCDPNFVLEYFRLSADKRLLFGGRLNYAGEDANVIRTRLRKKMLRIYPQLAGARIDFAWGGTIGVPLNRVPQLGRVGPGIYYCQGYSGHGVNVTHLAGRIMADAVAGTMEHFDVFAKVRPIVLPGAYLLRRPLVALGVLYYQLRDRL
ncbi:MAG: FAD-dependent oxidoreductase [Woeseiaceae bacterium]|nr:FAD-dependent oxidoreductase [Woeseiaceae bacterium]